MNILFICSRNQRRSPTGEAIFKNDPFHTAKSAGTEPSARIKVNAKIINWADIIFAMEKRHKQRLSENFPQEMLNKKVVILNIADDYKYMDPELVDAIKISTLPYLQNVEN